MKKKPTAKKPDRIPSKVSGKPRRKQPKNPYREAVEESVMDRINARCREAGFDPWEPCESETVQTGQSIRVEVPDQNVGFWRGVWRRVFE